MLKNNIIDNNKIVIKEEYYHLIFSLYNIIYKKLPGTHKKRKLDNFFLDNQGNIKLFFYGYELIEWILKSKTNVIIRPEAIKIAQTLLSLFIIVNPKLLDPEYISKNKKISNKKLLFSDDKTCYSLLSYSNIKSYKCFNNYLIAMNQNCKIINQYNPNEMIHIIFSKLLNDEKVDDKNDKIEYILEKENSENSILNSAIGSEESLSNNIYLDNSTSTLPSIDDKNEYNIIDLETVIENDSIKNNSMEDFPNKNNNENYSLIILDYNDEEINCSEYRWTKYYSLLVYLIVISTGGLALQWHSIYEILNAPPLIYIILGSFASILWFSFALLFFYSFFSNFKTSLENFKNGVHVPIYSAASFSLFQVADLSHFLNKTLGKVVFWGAVSLSIFTVSLLYYHLAVRIKNKKPISISTSLFFSGGVLILTSSVSSHLGYKTLSWVFFYYGLVYSLILHTIILIHYYINSRKGLYLPIDVIPAQGIFIGYTSITFGTLVSIQGYVSLLGRILYLFVYINIITVVILWIISIVKSPKRYIPSFNLGFWGFCFPGISLGVSSIIYYKHNPNIGMKYVSIVFITIGNLIYITLFLFTIVFLLKRNIFIVSKYNKSSFLSPKFNDVNKTINNNNSNNNNQFENSNPNLNEIKI